MALLALVFDTVGRPPRRDSAFWRAHPRGALEFVWSDSGILVSMRLRLDDEVWVTHEHLPMHRFAQALLDTPSSAASSAASAAIGEQKTPSEEEGPEEEEAPPEPFTLYQFRLCSYGRALELTHGGHTLRLRAAEWS